MNQSIQGIAMVAMYPVLQFILLQRLTDLSIRIKGGPRFSLSKLWLSWINFWSQDPWCAKIAMPKILRSANLLLDGFIRYIFWHPSVAQSLADEFICLEANFVLYDCWYSYNCDGCLMLIHDIFFLVSMSGFFNFFHATMEIVLVYFSWCPFE